MGEDAEAQAEAEKKAEAEAKAEAEEVETYAETTNAESAEETEAVAEEKVTADITPTEDEETGAKDGTELDEDATCKTESKDCEIVQTEEAEAQNEDPDDVFVNINQEQSEPVQLVVEVNESLVQENNIGQTEENTHEDEDPAADVTDSNAQCSSVRGSVDESSVLDHGNELEETGNNSFVEEDVNAGPTSAEEEQETIDK